MTATGSAPIWSSPFVNPRPRSGAWRNSSNELAVIRVPRACSGRARESLTFIESLRYAARPSKLRFCSRQSRTSAWDTLRRPARLCHVKTKSWSAPSKGNPRRNAAWTRVNPTALTPDAEGQGDDGRRRKPTFFEQEAEREAQVLEHGG